MLHTHVPDQLWTAEIPLSRLGFDIGARMTVVRLPERRLFIHSPVTLSPELKAELDALGPVRCIVAPSGMHYLDAAAFAAAYPEAKLYVAPAAQKKLSGTRIDAVLGDEPPPEWAGTLEQATFRGSRIYDEVDFFHPPTRTLILTDLLFHIPAESRWSTRAWGGLLGILGRTAPSRSFPPSILDRDAVRASLRRIAEWDFDRVILSHGKITETGGNEAFRRAFSWLLDG